MPVNRSKRGAGCALALLALVAADGLVAQETPSSASVVYEREVFAYPRSGRPDPFRSLLLDGDLGIRIEDLQLRGIVYHEDAANSIAALTLRGSDRRIQARVGERVGTLRVLGIFPDRVEIVVEELGVARRETLRIQAPDRRVP